MAPRPTADASIALPRPPGAEDAGGERARRAAERVPVATWTTDAALRITSAVGRGFAVLGVDAERLRGASLPDLRTPEAQLLSVAAHRRALEGRAEGWEANVAGRTVQAHVEPLRHGDAIVGTVGVAFEVTERARAQDELAAVQGRLQLLVEHRTAQLRRANAQLAREAMERERATAELQAARERLAFLVSGSPAVIYTARVGATLAATFTGANVRALTGYDPSCFVDTRFWIEHLHPDDRERVVSGLPRLFERGWHVSEYRFRCADGGYRWIHDGVRLVRDAAGEPVEIVGYWIDATERKRLELELREAKDAAETAVRERNEFLATISHEIRNPMNAIIGSAGLLLETPLTPDQQQYAGIVRRSAEALLGLVDDVLDLAKMEAGRLRLHVEELTADVAVDEVALLFAEQAYAKGLEIVTDVDAAAAVPVRADGGRLRQVLVNLVSNAIRFTDRGEVVVHATRVASDDDAVVLRFEVRDTGIGIPPEARPRLFQSFSQVEQPGGRRPGGSGLGLAISKRLVALMGGTIGVESTPGAGSTFWFTVRAEPATEAPVPPPPARYPRPRVLVVDDSPASRAALERAVVAAGAEVDAVASGTDALARLRAAGEATQRYALVLLDVDMPGMSGDEVARAVAADPALADNRLVLLRPFGRRDARRRPAPCVVATLAKPVRRAALRARLQGLLRHAAADAAPTAPRRARRAAPARTRRAAARILVVEDDVDIQTVTAHSLRKVGYQVDVVGTGTDAVEATSRTPYDLVLMDSRLPGMDGLTAARLIREREHGERRVRIVALTANVASHDEESCLAAGMDAVLRKPVRLRTLLEAVAAWAGGEPPRDPA